MVVKNIFPKVDYPKDKKSIEHIIKEYDNVLEYRLQGKPVEKKLMLIIYGFTIMIVLFLFKYKMVPLGILMVYSIPSFISIIYDIKLRKKVKNNDNKDIKLLFKSVISFLVLIWFFLYIGILLYEALLFYKWTYKEYLVSLLTLGAFSGLISIYIKMKVAKKFIKKYQYGNNKFFTMNSVIIAIIELLICIVYFRKPYLLLLITTYVLLPIYLGAIVNAFFEYSQYDKIQELKKEINYIPKEIKE